MCLGRKTFDKRKCMVKQKINYIPTNPLIFKIFFQPRHMKKTNRALVFTITLNRISYQV